MEWSTTWNIGKFYTNFTTDKNSKAIHELVHFCTTPLNPTRFHKLTLHNSKTMSQRNWYRVTKLVGIEVKLKELNWGEWEEVN